MLDKIETKYDEFNWKEKQIGRQNYCPSISNIYITRIKPSAMNTVTSQIEKHFQIHTVYKRGKRFLDIQKMNEVEHFQQVYRRMPHKSIESLDTHVDSSFLNSAEIALTKLNRDISIKRKRYEDTISDEAVEEQLKTLGSITLYSDAHRSHTLNRKKSDIKAPDMEKMSSRKQFGTKKIPYRNEDQFNNYAKSIKPKSLSINFDLLSPRSQQRLFQENQLNPEHYKTIDTAQKAYNRNTFNNTVMKCLFDLKKSEKKNSARKADYTSLKNSKPEEIPYERIEKAEKYAKRQGKRNMNQFYHSISRDVPSQLDFKITKSNEFYYQHKEMRKSKEDFCYRKRIQDMEEQRLKCISQRKQYPDKKGEMCDYQFFLRKKLRSLRK